MNEEVNYRTQRGLMQPQASAPASWEDDPEFQRAVREAKEVGAMVPNVIDFAQYKAAQARAKK